MVPDVIWIVAPDEDRAATMRLWRSIVPPIARRADRVIAISQASAEEIVRFLPVSRQRIDVVPLGPGVEAIATPSPEEPLRKRLALGDGPIVLAVSAKKAHKNLARLVEAMRLVTERNPTAMLVLPGRPTEHEAELRTLAAKLGLTANVAFPPYVDAADLEGLYAAASCFVLPSLNEGFGLPILEAMACGTPVLTTPRLSLAEVGGDAVAYTTEDPDRIASDLADLLHDEQRRVTLAKAGFDRAKEFTWASSAEVHVTTWKRVVTS
jgi:glycosyltransferase involved in cell wall biosynthesis